MVRVFEQSQVLKEIIEDHGWTLYDITLRSKGSPLTAYRKQPIRLKEVEKKGPALSYRKGGEYLVAPLPKEGRTLEQVCGETGFLGPSLWLPDEDILNFFGVRGIQIGSSGVYLFSRIYFSKGRKNGKNEYVIAYCPPGVTCSRDTRLDDLPRIIIPKKAVIDRFTNHFKITKREELAAVRYSNLFDLNAVDLAVN